MNTRFIITAVSTSALNLLLNAAAFVFVLKDFFETHPAGPPEFMKQLNRDVDQLIPWALAISALAMGVFITTVIKWSGATTFTSGLVSGLLVGFLFWTGVNFGIYASSNHFSLAAMLADLPCSALSMAISSGFAAWMLNRDRAQQESPSQQHDGPPVLQPLTAAERRPSR